MNEILKKFEQLKSTPSDINQHLETLKTYGKECDHITEMGVRGAVSTWALLAANPKKLVCYDISHCPAIDEIKAISEKYNIYFHFGQHDVLKIAIDRTDMLFIDTLHTYLQLKQELELHAPHVTKYIILHDTKTYGSIDEQIYGHASEKVKQKSEKSGLNTALNEFLETPNGQLWCIEKVFENNNGLTILKKKYDENFLKLDFLKRVLTDTVSSKDVLENFYSSGIFPTKEIMENTVKAPVEEARLNGIDWPPNAHTMIGIKRLNNLHYCLDQIRLNNIEGDLIETGVWRGGAAIFMKVYCNLYELNKKIFVADSFDGLPKPEVPEDEGDCHYKVSFLKVSLEEVKNNFKIYNALDENVIFLKGWFADTLPNNSLIKSLCVLRMDGDMYKSTMDVFESCYNKVTKNGFIIIDDYCLGGCQKATNKFREDQNIKSPLIIIDGCGRYWRK